MHLKHPLPFAVRWAAIVLAGLVATVGLTGTVAGSSPDEEALDAAISAQRARLALGQDAEALNDLANLLVLSGDLAEAEAAYRDALQLNGERIEVIYNLALLLQHDGRTREALKLFRRVVDLSSDAAWAHLQIGVISSDLGKRKSAVKAFQRAFELEPRLASRAVNPHVADRPEAVQALLSAGNDRPARSAPLSFTEPDRVARMLLADAAVTRAATRAAQNRGLLPEDDEPVIESDSDPTRAAAEKRKARRLEVESLPGERERPTESRESDSTAEPSIDDELTYPEEDLEDAEAELQRFRDQDEATVESAEAPQEPVRRVVGVQDLRDVRGAGASSSGAGSSSGNRRTTTPTRTRQRPSAASSAPSGGASRFRPGRRSSARLELKLGEEPVQVATSRWAPAPARAEGR